MKHSLPMILLLALCLPLLAQTNSKGVINGRVVADDGSPLPGMTVRLSLTGAFRREQTRTTSTDDEGNFRFADLPPRAYSIAVLDGRAFVAAPKTAAERAEPHYVRIGDNVTLTMIRGGVITGRVTNANGEALIAIPLKAIPLRDADGNPVSEPSFWREAATDDRGIYRFYGLPPGTYIVLANYGNPYFDMQASLYDGETATYFPSSTRDTAAEVRVTSGGEATGIDIRYRGERGHAISGKLLDAKDAVNVSLLHVGTESQIASKYVPASTNNREPGFDFYGIPDGEYEVIARSNDDDVAMASSPRRISVKGADVTGLELRMLSLGTIAGRVVTESAEPVCDKTARTSLEEFAVSARPEEKLRAETDPVTRPNSNNAPINDKGEFELRLLNAARYRLALNLPNEHLFVKAISMAAAAKPATTTAAKTAPPIDLARGGMLLKQGEKLSGVTITLTNGAASVRGKVSVREGARLPSRMRVHLIPAEPTAADDLLRYAEKIAASDGSFAFSNLAPGKYWLLARAVPDDELADRPPSPAAWATADRTKLRKDAESAKQELELKACQRVKDFVLRW